MSIYEYDEELHERTLMEIGREEGISIGRDEGISIGRKEGVLGTITALRNYGCDDAQIVKMLMDTYNLTQEEAVTYMSQHS